MCQSFFGEGSPSLENLLGSREHHVAKISIGGELIPQEEPISE